MRAMRYLLAFTLVAALSACTSENPERVRDHVESPAVAVGTDGHDVDGGESPARDRAASPSTPVRTPTLTPVPTPALVTPAYACEACESPTLVRLAEGP